MPPKAKTRATKKTTASDEEPQVKVAPAPRGFKQWKTTTRIFPSGELSDASQYNPVPSKFTQVVEVHHNESFTLRPLILADGTLKGRHVLVLEPVPDPEQFRFMDLPPELRTMIYQLLLEKAGMVELSAYKPRGQAVRSVGRDFRRKRAHRDMTWDPSARKWMGETPSDFSIMRVSKQILQETAAMTYGLNTFSFLTLGALKAFADTVGDNCKLLRNVHIGRYGYQSSKARSAFYALRNAKGLRSLTFEHPTVCTKGSRFQGMTTVGRLIADCTTMLKALHKAQKDDHGEEGILDLIRITGEAVQCYQCRLGLTSAAQCMAWSCKINCKDRPQHFREINAEVRAGVAKVLGIEEADTAEEE